VIDRRQPRPSGIEEVAANMSLRKPLAALAAVMVALALALPAVSATAAPAARTASVGVDGGLLGAGGSFLGVGGLLPPGSPPCLLLVSQIQFAHLTHNTLLESFFGNVFIYSGCGGAAI
jgi:hypothetical protein